MTESWDAIGGGENLYNSSSEGLDADERKWLWCYVDKPAQFLAGVFQSLCAVIYKLGDFMR